MCWLVGDPLTASFTARVRYPDVIVTGAPSAHRRGSRTYRTRTSRWVTTGFVCEFG
jgi:hypothetical protein